MKIAIVHLTTVHPRTDTRVILKEACTLASQLSARVIALVADGKGEENLDGGPVSIQDLGCLAGGRIRRALVGSWRAFFAIRNAKPHIVHFHDPELILLGMILQISGYKVIYDVHEDVPRQILSKEWIPSFLRRQVALITGGVEWVGARIVSAIVAATPKIATRFPAEKSFIVQNFPITHELLLPCPTPYCQRPYSFVYPGVIASFRGLVEMVRAFELLDNTFDARLDLAGTFTPFEFAATLKSMPRWNAVHYHGEVNRMELAHLLDKARAGLVLHHSIPNEIDAFPIKLFEYMATGLPVIASDFPPLRKIIHEERCGLIVDQSDPSAIANAIRWICNNPTEAEAMGQRGRYAVERRYNWDAEGAKLIALYNKLLVADT